jgi:MFS family permease
MFIIAAIASLLISRRSDQHQERAFYLLVCVGVGVVGFIGLAGFTPGTGLFLPASPSCVADSQGNKMIQASVPLAFALLAVIGVSATVPLKCAWFSASIPRHRSTVLAVGTAMLVAVGSSGAFLSPFIYAWLGFPVGQESDTCIDQHAVHSLECLLILKGTKEEKTDYNYAHLTMAGSLMIAAGMIVFLKWRLNRQRRLLERTEVQNLCWTQLSINNNDDDADKATMTLQE